MKKALSIIVIVSLLVGVLCPAMISGAQAGPDANTPPTRPVPIGPSNQAVVSSRQPTLWFYNAFDADGDELTYDIIVSPYSAFDQRRYETVRDLHGGEDSTAYRLKSRIDENSPVWWQVRACDGQACSDWTLPRGFWVDAVAESPSAPVADFPNDRSTLPQFEMLPVFTFRHSLDPDPLDTVRYCLELATDSGFAYATRYDSLTDDGIFIDYALCDSLTFGTQYFWRVVATDRRGMTAISNVQRFWTWLPGDLDHSHQINIADLVFLVSYMFAGGPPAEPPFTMDLNGDCTAPDIADLIHLVQYMFSDGAPPGAGCLHRSGLL